MAPSRRIAWLLTALVLRPGASAAEPTDRELIEAVQRQVQAVMGRAEPAIACVVVSRSERYPDRPASTENNGKLGTFHRARFLQTSTRPDKLALSRRLDLADRASIPDNAFGGGVVIDAGGLVLTPYHVIDGATKIYVHLPGGKGSYADIHAADARADLAVLKLISPPPNLKAVRIADVRIVPAPASPAATIARGQFTIVMANAFDSAFAGRPLGVMAMLTGLRERPTTRAADDAQPRLWTHYHYGTLLQYVNQFPAGRPSRLNLGLSGAALFNLDGELIGLTTTASPLAAGEDAAGYALPMDEHARRAIDVLKRGEEVEYGFLGVTSSEHPLGLSILVSPHGPADEAGLRDRDVIRQLDGHPIASHKDLFFHVGSALAGHRVKVRVQRFPDRAGPGQGNTPVEREVEVALGKYQHGLPFIASSRPEPVFGLRVDHGSVLLQQLLGNDFAIRVPPGVSVRELVPGSPAEKNFKAINDVGGRWIVTHVNGTRVTTPREFHAAARGKPAVTLTLIDPTVPTPRPRELTLP